MIFGVDENSLALSVDLSQKWKNVFVIKQRKEYIVFNSRKC